MTKKLNGRGYMDAFMQMLEFRGFFSEFGEVKEHVVNYPRPFHPVDHVALDLLPFRLSHRASSC